MDGTRQMMRSIAGADYRTSPEVYEKLSLNNCIGSGNSPIFFMEAELEHMFFPEDTLRLAHRLRGMGVKCYWKMYRNMEHGFFYALTRAGQREAFDDIVLFMEGELNIPLPEKCERYRF